MTKKVYTTSDFIVFFNLAVVGFIFARSSIGKITGGEFISGLGGTLQKFASENPYLWFKGFLEVVAIPNSQVFGILTMWGEFFAGFGVLVSLVCLYFLGSKNKLFVYLLGTGLLVGAFLSATFYFAAGWMSPSTDGLNLLMCLIQLAGLAYVFKLNRS